MAWQPLRSVGSRSESLLSLDHGFDSVVHVLDEVDFGATESAQVRDVEDAVVGLGVLAVGTADLDVVLVGNGLHEIGLLHQLWEVDVDGSSKSGSEVGWAVGDVSKMVVLGESSLGLNNSSGGGESLEDLLDVGTLLHGDDSKLILLIDPHEEGLGIIMEDTSSVWPVSVEVASSKESISLPIVIKIKFEY